MEEDRTIKTVLLKTDKHAYQFKLKEPVTVPEDIRSHENTLIYMVCSMLGLEKTVFDLDGDNE